MRRIRLVLTLPFMGLALLALPVAGTRPVAAAAAPAGQTAAAAAPDFTVTVDPLSQTRKRGTGAPYFVTVNCLNGFNGAVTLSLSGDIPPTGTVSTDNPTGCGALHDGEVAIQIEKHSTLTGTFPMTIHASGAGVEHDVNISLTIV